MDAINLEATALEQIRKDFLCEVNAYDGRLSKGISDRLNRLPRNIRKQLVDTDYKGLGSSLFIACGKGDVEMIKYLITECDANIEHRAIMVDSTRGTDEVPKDKMINYVTPLFCACKFNNFPVVKCLVSLGSDVNALSGIGLTPLTAACKSENFEMVKYLIENGADVQATASSGVTYLIDSIESEPLCRYLISKGVDVNGHDSNGNTALHCAVENEGMDTIELLLDHGADPFAKNHSGDDALQIACIAGALEIADYLLDRINYSSKRRADARFLMGSSLIYFDDDTHDVVQQWRLALDAQMGETDYTQTRTSTPPRAAYRNMVEISTIAELDAIGTNVDALRMQGLLIQERILGVDHEYTSHRLMIRGSFYKGSRQFQTCIDLWTLALEVRIRNHTVLDRSTCDTASDLVKLMVNLSTNNEPMMPRFKDVYATFQLLTSSISDIQPLLHIHSANGNQQANFDCILRCLTNLISTLLSVAQSEDEHRLIESSVRSLVAKNMRTASKATLLHLAVLKINIMPSEYSTNQEDEERIFSNLPATKLLLECGARINAYNKDKSTPLLFACRPRNYEKEVVRTLIEYGAHLDLQNVFGERPSSLLRANPANDINLGHHISLKHLCAKALNAPDIPNRNKIPWALQKFVQARQIYPCE
ncbi:protein fem-1 homolog C-like [Toxorhynchites rutilus septentrionalis]|uniref:protein fem-1 homolog C-like n=1 Tax=Toxorhynchites rutilus septentrionalis TaxID=329112 RepID=UPI002478C6B8|nr:protein fem-1 homolog C-like [Toxorhynchites rutilus septentrionalis]